MSSERAGTDQATTPHPVLAVDAHSAQWVQALTPGHPEQQEAISRLHEVLLRFAKAEAFRRSGLNGIEGRELEDLAHQSAADAVVSILRKLPEFRGESRFTTWAYKFVVFEISSKLGRHVWRRDGVNLDREAWDRLPDRLGGPEGVAEANELVMAVRQAVDEELTPHQRRVFVALVVNGTPLDALVIELGTNRNALYKTMFDARRKLRSYLVTNGYIQHDAGRGA